MQIKVHSVERYTPLDYTLGEDLYCTEPSPAGPHTAVHSDTNQWFFNRVDDKRQLTRVLLILALVISRTVNLEGTGCVLDGWTRWLLSVLRVAQTSK